MGARGVPLVEADEDVRAEAMVIAHAAEGVLCIVALGYLLRAVVVLHCSTDHLPRPRRVVTQDEHRYALYISLRALFPRLTARHIKAIVNRRVQERQGAKR